MQSVFILITNITGLEICGLISKWRVAKAAALELLHMEVYTSQQVIV